MSQPDGMALIGTRAPCCEFVIVDDSIDGVTPPAFVGAPEEFKAWLSGQATKRR